MNPEIMANLANQHILDLQNEAENYRMATRARRFRRNRGRAAARRAAAGHPAHLVGVH